MLVCRVQDVLLEIGAKANGLHFRTIVKLVSTMSHEF